MNQLNLYNSYLPMCNVYSLQNGLVSSLPYLLNCIISVIVSWLADWLIQSGKLSRGFTRKLMTSIGFMGPAIALIGMSFVGCNPFLAVILLCLGVMLDGVGYAGMDIINFLLKRLKS